MFEFDLDKMLFCIPKKSHNKEAVRKILNAHKEVKFISLVGIDIGGNDTDEKIPVELFLEDYDKIMASGVQTDGSSVVLPKIAVLNNAKVDIIPDKNVNWYVDHNFKNLDFITQLPIGTLRIPATLIHNNKDEVGSRAILKASTEAFKSGIMELLKNNPYVFENLDIEKFEDIESVSITSATELEFWVKTPDDQADRDELSTAQVLKEQYWKRTIGPVRSALEGTVQVLDKYGLEVEMAHKEVGGVKAKMGHSGHYDHVMEQLEIDWKYSGAMQAADNENMVKYVVRDIFRLYGLEVTFAAKPLPGIAGSGEHTHLGATAKLKNGKVVNLFSPVDMREDFASPIGFGALMGILKNYEAINPFVAKSNDAFRRLKPGYEAPICVVTSLGHSPRVASRNRTILIGLIRDNENKMATRFELRAPCPTSNTYLLLAASYMAMIDGIDAALTNQKTSKDLEKSLSKKYGQEDFYLEKNRMYRSEENVYDSFTEDERNVYFGKAPATVWENLSSFVDHPEKYKVLKRDNVMKDLTIESFKVATTSQWATELHSRIVPNVMDLIRQTVKLHDDATCEDYDLACWSRINKLRLSLGKTTLIDKCLLTKLLDALEEKDYDLASDFQIHMEAEVEKLTELYSKYKRNLF